MMMNFMAPQLISCPSCECHARATEAVCPHCGARLQVDGNRLLSRSATAVALGLSAVLSAAGCEEPVPEPVYGVAVTGGAGGEAGTGGAGGAQGGMGGAGGAQGGMAGAGGK
jgi:hypothetical protein